MDAYEGMPVHAQGQMWVLPVIADLFTRLEDMNLVVTHRVAIPLREIQTRLQATAADHRLTKQEAEELSAAAKRIRETLFAEAQGNVAFIVTDKRYDVNRLLANIGALMAPGVFDKLPDIAKYDFSEAGKCIAFERPTAAAFHLLRVTEGVLRKFYLSIVKRGRSDLMWGPMIISLRKRKKSRPPDVLLNNLDNIRVSFRNPTQHPEKIYDIQEAQDLFGLCVDVVSRMIGPTGSQEVLSGKQP